MIIVFSSPQFLPLIGGVENVVYDWANALSELGETVNIITQTDGESAKHWLFQVYRKPTIWEQLKILRKADVVVQFNVSIKGFISILLSRKPLVISHQSSVYYSNGRPTSWAWLKTSIAKYYAKKNVACSKFLAKGLNKKTIVVPNPYNNKLYKNLGFTQKKYDIVFLGRLVSDKGCRVLLEAILVLKQSGILLSVQIIGDGEEKGELIEFVVKQKLDNQVVFKGSMSGNELLTALNLSNIMVVPSIWDEPFGIVALEGLACGCTVVVSQSGGLPEAVDKFGYFFPKGNSEVLAQILSKLFYKELATNPNQQFLDQHLDDHSAKMTAQKMLKTLKNSN